MSKELRVRLTEDQVNKMYVLWGKYRTPTNTKIFDRMLRECYEDFKNNL